MPATSSTVPPEPRRLAAALGAFAIGGALGDVRPHGNGHIHDTFVATFAPAKGSGPGSAFLLQRVNTRVFPEPERMMENIAGVTAHLRGALARRGENADGRRVLHPVATRAGGLLHRDAEGDCWRVYDFIAGSYALERPQSAAQAFAAARLFARFQRLLDDYAGPRLFETIPRFHDAPRRFATFLAALDRDAHGRAAAARGAIDEALAGENLAGGLLRLHAAGVLPERITHNDTKLNNVLFDEATGAGLCVTDLDTVMPGLALYDFGDLVRTATSSAAEDEPDAARVEVRVDMFRAVAAGWMAGAGTSLLAAERERLVLAGRLLSFECGLRFLTDFLDGDRYFKIHRGGQNLDRCRAQFALAASLARHEEALQAWVAAHAAEQEPERP